MITDKQIVNLPAEIILWMIYVKKFDSIKLKYRVKLRFDPKFIYFEPAHNSLNKEQNVIQAVQEAEKVGNSEYELRFLMKDTKVIYNYHLYIKMIQTNEYRDLTKKFNGLCIMVKDKFIKLQHELAENAGYRGEVKMNLPNSYVLAWMPRSKANFIVQQLSLLLQSACLVKIKPLDAVWFHLYIDSFEKNHTCRVELQESQNQMEVKITAPNSSQIRENALDLMTHNSLIHFPYELDEVQQFDQKEMEATLKEKANPNTELWPQQKVIEIAQSIDKKFSTTLSTYIGKYTKLCNYQIQVVRKSYYLFCRPEDQDKALQILRTNLEERIKLGQESVVKDYLISSEENGFKIHFYNTKVGLQLVNNTFDQNDFDQFLAQYYNLPYEVKVHRADKQLSFQVKVPFNQREIKNIVIEMLDSYVNHCFYYIINYAQINCEIGKQYNCKIESFRSNTSYRGLLDFYAFEGQSIDQNNYGDSLVIKVSNILHSKKHKLIQEFNQNSLRSDIFQQMANDKKRQNFSTITDDAVEKCKILKLTQSHLDLCKKMNLEYQIIKQAEQYLEDSFYVTIQYRGNQLSEAIERMKLAEKDFLYQFQSDKEISIQERTKSYDLYSVCIQEFFFEYYGNIRMQLLNDNNDSEITMEKQQSLFYINITKLNIPIFNLVPIITVIEQISNSGIVYSQLSELPSGRYLLGYALTNAKEFQLSAVKYIIRQLKLYFRYIVQIHEIGVSN